MMPRARCELAARVASRGLRNRKPPVTESSNRVHAELGLSPFTKPTFGATGMGGLRLVVRQTSKLG